MGIYLGDTKITGTGVQIDNSMSSTSTHAVTNAAITEALSEVGYTEWKKPADWIDIQSGALPNSVYFLVGHSADYSSYPAFTVKATVSNSGTYDVYVDGIKQATTASGTATTLTWQTLALTSGYNVTYPAPLRTHIVSIIPTVSTNTFSAVQATPDSFVSQQGLLWVHFNISNAISLYKFSTMDYNSITNPILEAITSQGDALKVSNLSYAFAKTPKLFSIPTLLGTGTISSSNAFFYAENLEKVSFSGGNYNGFAMFQFASKLKRIYTEQGANFYGNELFFNATSLKKLPEVDWNQLSVMTAMINNTSDLESFFVNLGTNKSLTRLQLKLTNSLTGITVSNEAPFNSATSPQLDVSYTGLNRDALVNLFNSMPTVIAGQVCNVTGCMGADDLTAEDLAIATGKGWTVTR